MSQQVSPRPNRRPEFVTLIAVYQFVTAGILLLLSCLIIAVLFPAMFVSIDAAGGIFTAVFMTTVMLTLLLGFAFASLVVGWGLLRSREWARLGAIVLAAFALIGFPIWTIVAILILIYLTSEDGRAAFRRVDSPPDMASQAVYKAEPPTSPTEETRRMTYTGPVVTGHEGNTEGAPANTVSGDETGSVPMPTEDPAWATETFYDTEADVSDHYRRRRAASGAEVGESPDAETVEMPAEPPEEAQPDDGTGSDEAEDPPERPRDE